MRLPPIPDCYLYSLALIQFYLLSFSRSVKDPMDFFLGVLTISSHLEKIKRSNPSFYPLSPSKKALETYSG